jgi:hypothetical protein
MNCNQVLNRTGEKKRVAAALTCSCPEGKQRQFRRGRRGAAGDSDGAVEVDLVSLSISATMHFRQHDQEPPTYSKDLVHLPVLFFLYSSLRRTKPAGGRVIRH